MTRWRVGLVYNLKQNVQPEPGAPPDALAEYDAVETVQALREALAANGHEVVDLEADLSFLDTVRAARPDICFNIAEGLRGDSRESHVPAILEMLGIPYTGSKVLTHAISLDKAAAKHIWQNSGIPTAPFQVFRTGLERLDARLEFPLFVKPIREGTGMGINARSVVHDERELRDQARWVIETYRQPALVETYLPGREFTVGLIGNTLWPGQPPFNELYDERGFHLFPVLEINAQVGVGQGVYNTAAKSYHPGEEGAPEYLCPAPISPELEAALKQLAVAAFEAIGALDVARVDMRLDAHGNPNVIEINTLPGLNPTVSDLCIMAHAEGMSYARLIGEILNLAACRYGMLPERQEELYGTPSRR